MFGTGNDLAILLLILSLNLSLASTEFHVWNRTQLQFVYRFYALLKVQPFAVGWNVGAILPSNFGKFDLWTMKIFTFQCFISFLSRQNMHYWTMFAHQTHKNMLCIWNPFFIHIGKSTIFPKSCTLLSIERTVLVTSLRTFYDVKLCAPWLHS